MKPINDLIKSSHAFVRRLDRARQALPILLLLGSALGMSASASAQWSSYSTGKKSAWSKHIGNNTNDKWEMSAEIYSGAGASGWHYPKGYKKVTIPVPPYVAYQPEYTLHRNHAWMDTNSWVTMFGKEEQVGRIYVHANANSATPSGTLSLSKSGQFIVDVFDKRLYDASPTSSGSFTFLKLSYPVFSAGATFGVCGVGVDVSGSVSVDLSATASVGLDASQSSVLAQVGLNGRIAPCAKFKAGVDVYVVAFGLKGSVTISRVDATATVKSLDSDCSGNFTLALTAFAASLKVWLETLFSYDVKTIFSYSSPSIPLFTIPLL